MLQWLGCKHLRVNSSFQAGLTHRKLINKVKLEHKDNQWKAIQQFCVSCVAYRSIGNILEQKSQLWLYFMCDSLGRSLEQIMEFPINTITFHDLSCMRRSGIGL